MILDEPFSGLDPLAVDAMVALLREEVTPAVPVLFSSHQLELVERLADDLVILSRGRVVAAGSSTAPRAGSAYRLWWRHPGWLRDVACIKVATCRSDALFDVVVAGQGTTFCSWRSPRGGARVRARARGADRHLPGGGPMSDDHTTPRHPPKHPSTQTGPWVLVASARSARKLRDKTSLASTAFMLVIMMAAVLVPALFAGNNGQDLIAVLGGAGRQRRATADRSRAGPI